MPRSCSMASYITRAIWNWRSTTRTPTATQRSTSRPSPYSGGASVLASVASSTSGSTGLTETATYGILTDQVARADHTIDIEVTQGQWERMGQFYSSLATGHTTASVALQRLVACPAKNRFYRANRDLGRVFKTEFLLSYLSEPQLRSRIRRGLLNVEQLHALARDVYYGRRGRINARELHEQMNSCSCLTLILACIIYWQAKQITRTMLSGDLAQEGIDATLIQHISPIEWDNVIFYGQYVLDRALVR